MVNRQEGCGLTYPVRKSKVDSFSKVESLIEASMVGTRERDDELTSTLVSTNNLREKMEGGRRREGRERGREGEQARSCHAHINSTTLR